MTKGKSAFLQVCLLILAGLCFAAEALHDHSADVARSEAGKAKLESGYYKQALHSVDGHTDDFSNGCQNYGKC